MKLMLSEMAVIDECKEFSLTGSWINTDNWFLSINYVDENNVFWNEIEAEIMQEIPLK